ncbi:MAG: hypothetical protein GXY50_08805 [Syntrophomonadaceae bacterium]|nr:hypothetical protein [Syntrophomonadaceae bacterium]
MFRGDEKGLGLIEVLAAMALLSLGVVILFGGFVNAHTWNRNAGQRSRAILFASGVIEELKARPDKVEPTSGSSPGQLDLELEVPEDLEVAVVIRSYDESLQLFMVEVSCGRWEGDRIKTENLTTILEGEG